jgi:hypothetical protein
MFAQRYSASDWWDASVPLPGICVFTPLRRFLCLSLREVGRVGVGVTCDTLTYHSSEPTDVHSLYHQKVYLCVLCG